MQEFTKFKILINIIISINLYLTKDKLHIIVMHINNMWLFYHNV